MKKNIILLGIFVLLTLSLPLVSIIDSPKDLQDTSINISKDSDSSMVSQVIESQESSENQSEAPQTPPPNPINTANTIKIFNHKTQTVEEMSINDYIKGVVCAEMPASFHEEAIKAQAVIAHTYALRIMGNEIKSPTPELLGANISTDSNKHQAYLSQEELKERYKDNFDTYYTKISDCVEAVINEVLTYQDEPILATFHAISGGKTEDAQNVWGQKVPYLVGTESPEDESKDNFLTTTTLTEEEVTAIVQKEYPNADFTQDKAGWFTILSRTLSDYVSTISVLGNTISGQDFRKLFGLRSANFTISYSENQFTIATKGYGHGVGLSQNGANLMATGGKNYKEILAHYYPNTTLTPIS